MSERIPREPAYPDFGKRILDAFYPDHDEQRKAFEDRGLIPTNNLNLYIKDDPKPELDLGFPNIHDYRQRSFGFAIEELKNEHPDLWERAKVAIAESGRLRSKYSDLLWEQKREEAKAMEEALDSAIWAARQACDEIFRIIAPKLEAVGIDPLEICV